MPDSVANRLPQNRFGVVGQDGVDNGQRARVLDRGVQRGDRELVDDLVQSVAQTRRPEGPACRSKIADRIS